MSDRVRVIVRFGLYELDLEAQELRRAGQLVRLAPQALRLLIALTETPDLVVTRERLRRALWADDTHVEFERSLNTAIRKLRAALRDDADRARYIQTVHGRGYRFIAPVQRIQPAPAARIDAGGRPDVQPKQAPPPLAEDDAIGDLAEGSTERRAPGRVTIAAWLACAAAAGWLLIAVWQAGPRRIPIAVRATGVDAVEREVPSASRLMESLQVHLGRLDPSRLVVVGESVRGCHELVVSRHPGGRTALRLLDVCRDQQLWARAVDAIPAEQVEPELLVTAGRAVVDVLLGGDARARLVAATSSDRALQAYHEGQATLNGERILELSRGVEAFEAAVRIDPHFAPAWAALAHARAARAMVDGRDEAELQRARGEAQRALERDGTLADAHLALGQVRFALDGDAAGAEAVLRRAGDLGATRARDPVWLVWVLSARGRYGEALEVLDETLAHEPRRACLHAWRGFLLHALQRYDEELDALRRAVSIDPQSPESLLHLGLGYSRRGQYELALPALRRAVTLSDSGGVYLSWLGRVAADAGDVAAAQQVLQQLRAIGPTRGLAPALSGSVEHHIQARRHL